MLGPGLEGARPLSSNAPLLEFQSGRAKINLSNVDPSSSFYLSFCGFLVVVEVELDQASVRGLPPNSEAVTRVRTR